MAFWVAQPRCDARPEDTGEHLHCIGGKGKRCGRSVLFELADVALPGIGTTNGFCANSQASANCAGLQFWRRKRAASSVAGETDIAGNALDHHGFPTL